MPRPGPAYILSHLYAIEGSKETRRNNRCQEKLDQMQIPRQEQSGGSRHFGSDSGSGISRMLHLGALCRILLRINQPQLRQ